MPGQVYVQKPRKVHAEQFATATTPWPASVCTQASPFGICTTTPLFPDWRPHVHGDGRIYELHDGDWLTVPAAFPEQLPIVLTNAQFEELYGPQPAEGG